MPTAAEVMVKALENENVKYIFGIPGEENIDFMEAVRNSNIQFILTRHEQGAGFMADIYGRLTGKAGVCLATLGPGATNLFTPVADANLDRAPLVAITAQCYYRDDRVMQSLGMEARPPYPLGFTLEQGDWSLLDPVRKREKFYRVVPPMDAAS